MGKFVIKVSGTDRKNEIISESYYVNDASEETKNACIAIYQDDWSCYEPYNIVVTVTDVEALYFNFKPCDAMQVKNRIYDMKRQKEKEEADERAMYDTLKQKYEAVNIKG